METYKDLIEFLQKASDSNHIKFHTARTRKTALRRIFSGSNFENFSIFEVDIDNVITEFASKNSGISDDTINSYKTRFKSSLQDYIRYEKLGEEMAEVSSTPEKAIEIIEAKPVVIDLPCPIRNAGHIINVNNLPVDLTMDELNRLVTLIKDFINIKE